MGDEARGAYNRSAWTLIAKGPAEHRLRRLVPSGGEEGKEG